jgi:hypothetical protein
VLKPLLTLILFILAINDDQTQTVGEKDTHEVIDDDNSDIRVLEDL